MKSQALTHLTVLEETYNVKLRNKEEIAELIAEKAMELGVEPIHICTALNTWLAMQISEGNVEEGDEITIPKEIVEGMKVKED
ncbi:MAG: hypothetical protein GXO28_03165 [Methanopyri archaeon]|nr:hypothetical protein [Methanopyri archaeon]